jgi:hypothetical protein
MNILDALANVSGPYPNGANDDELPLGDILQVSDDAWDPTQLPPRPWIAPPYVMLGQITLAHGSGGVGKSVLLSTWAVAMALGLAFGRLDPIRQCRVLLANFEDDEDEQRRRLSAALKFFPGNPNPAGLEGYLYRVGAGDDATPTMFDVTRDGAVRSTRAYEALDMWCREIRPDVLVLDPFVAISAVPESDNTLMRRVMGKLRQLTRSYEMALVLAHHDRKSGGGDEDSDTDNVRGAGDIVNAVRFELAVKKMTTAEAERFNLDPKTRTSYFRLGSPSSKLNYTAPDEAEWFERVTHVISGEPVAACIPWVTPNAFNGITAALANAILDEIDAGLPGGDRYSHSPNATSRAAWRLILKHAPTKSEKEARRIIAEWVKNDVLIPSVYLQPGRREKVKGLWVNPKKRPGAIDP